MLGGAGAVSWYNLDGSATQRYLVLPFMELLSESVAGQARWTVASMVALGVSWLVVEVALGVRRRGQDGK